MELDSDFEPFEGFSALDIPETNSDIDWEDDSNSDNDVVDFTESDSHNVWTDELHNISTFPLSQPVGLRHDLSEEASVLDYFSLLLEPDFVNWIAQQTNLYAKQRQQQLRHDIRWEPTNADEIRAFFT